MKKTAVIDLTICNPGKCNPQMGVCPAAQACNHKVLEPEAPFEPPALLSESLCVEDGNCAAARPLNAAKAGRGSFT